MKHTTPSRDKGKPSVSVVPLTTDTFRTRPNMFINLALTSHTLEAIQQVLTATPATNHCTTTHISYPTLMLTMTQLYSLNGLVQANLNQNRTHLVIFHHLCIATMSTLPPGDRTLKITLDNTIHTLTPPRTGSVATPHHLHLYLNPHNRLPYLQHTCNGTGGKSNHVIVTTSLRCHQYESTNARRRPMLRTTSHAPDFITTLTFPVDSIHHQQSILTLATHMILTVPIVTPQQSWNIICEKDSHRYTLQLILATITLKRHYIIWHTVQDHSPATQPTSHQPTEHLSTRPTRRNTLPQRHQHPKPQRHTGS